MNLLKLVTTINWAAIGLLAMVAVGMIFFSNKGGDAATRGMGEGIGFFAAGVMVVLLFLNLLPWKWTKYTALALILAPFIYLAIGPSWRRFQYKVASIRAASQPIFEDEERDRMAKAIRDGEPEKLRPMLQASQLQRDKQGELLAFAISEAAHSSYKPVEKLECVQILFDAGAELESTSQSDETPVHVDVAYSGNAALLRLLLRKGADANARNVSFNRHILFEAVGSYREPEACVRALLEFGADPNATAVFDEGEGPLTPLLRAAQLAQWRLCGVLLEYGANPDYQNDKGLSLHSIMERAEGNFDRDEFLKRAGATR